MYETDSNDADVILRGVPMRLPLGLEYHLLYHHALCEALIRPTEGRTWDELGDDLAWRFPPHVWHPDHWTAYEEVFVPSVETEPGPVDARRPRRRRRGADTDQETLF